jgi:hypothetical protein
MAERRATSVNPDLAQQNTERNNKKGTFSL